MKVLFVHQNFPGQYRHVAAALAEDTNNEVLALGESKNLGRLQHPRITEVGYASPEGAGTKTHHYIHQFEASVRRGQQVVRAASQLKKQGFEPDIICCHPSWGEGLYLKDIWPDAVLLYFFEFFYHAEGRDTAFDPEFPLSKDGVLKTRTRNAVHLLSLNVADWGISPTYWQHDSMPKEYRNNISVIFDGVDTDIACPAPHSTLKLNNDFNLTNDDEVITFVSRNLEPYRGYHIFIRALPKLMQERPNAHIVIVGDDGVSYGSKPPKGETYKQHYLDEVKEQIDMSRIHFLGHVSYNQFLDVLRISSIHVYLTYPFVLSWSMIEAMSIGCTVVASDTPPVREVIDHEKNGLLFDFFDPEALVEQVCCALDRPELASRLGQAARQTAVKKYDLKRVCLPQQLALIKTLAAGERPKASQEKS